MKDTVRGNKALAERLGVSERTVGKWRSEGVLDRATLSSYGRVIIYDMDKVYDCLRYPEAKHSRKPSRTA